MLPTPGGVTSPSRVGGEPAEPSAAQTVTRSVASTECTASTCGAPSGPSTRATSERTPSCCSGTTGVQACGAQVAGSAGSATESRQRGASRSLISHSRPSRATHAAVCASTPTCTSRRGGRAAGGRAAEVGQPDVVARRGADRGGDHQPAALPAGPHAEIGGRVAALAVHEVVALGVGAHPVAPHAAVELLLAGGDQPGGQPA